MKASKKEIKVVVADNSEAVQSINFLKNIFEVTVVPHKEAFKNPLDIDLVLFTGGSDVNPEFYGQNVGKFTSIDATRDNLEQDVFYQFKYVPKLGICRGAQFLTVLNGGRLIQHVTGHGSAHEISVKNYGNCTIPSTHHQMMYPYNLNPDKYEIIAHSTLFKSTTYLDGDNKEVELKNDFLEPEIVEYKGTKTLCIQGHPEFAETPKDTLDLVLHLISKWYDRSVSEREKAAPKPMFSNPFDGVVQDGSGYSWGNQPTFATKAKSGSTQRWKSIQVDSGTQPVYMDAFGTISTVGSSMSDLTGTGSHNTAIGATTPTQFERPFTRVYEPQRDEPTAKSEGLENTF